MCYEVIMKAVHHSFFKAKTFQLCNTIIFTYSCAYHHERSKEIFFIRHKHSLSSLTGRRGGKSLNMERKFTKEIMCDVGCGNMRMIWRQYVEPHERKWLLSFMIIITGC